MKLRNANTASGFEFDMGSTVSGLEFTYLLFVVQFLADALPYVFDIVIVFLAMRVMNELGENRYSDQAVMYEPVKITVCQMNADHQVLETEVYQPGQMRRLLQ